MSVRGLAARLSRWRFLRFATVGAAGFGVNEIALAAFIKLAGLDPYTAGIASFFVAATFTWWGNRLLTFREHAAGWGRGLFEEWARFIAANGLGFLVNYAVYAGLITFAPSPFGVPFVALAFGTIAGLALNFTLSSRFVFRR